MSFHRGPRANPVVRRISMLHRFVRRPFMKWALLLSVLAVSALAQSERGTIAGTVTDSSGAVIPRAKVTVTNEATNITLKFTTNEAGDIFAPSGSGGSHPVRLSKEEFRSVRT